MSSSIRTMRETRTPVERVVVDHRGNYLRTEYYTEVERVTTTTTYTPGPDRTEGRTRASSSHRAASIAPRPSPPLLQAHSYASSSSRASANTVPSYASSPRLDFNVGRRAPTAADLRRIPAGYDWRDWDASEEPILLLGKVFDCNSLGKMLFDTALATYPHEAPQIDRAGELWLLLLQLFSKANCVEDVVGSVRSCDEHTLQRFLHASGLLHDQFMDIVRRCERRARDARDPRATFVHILFGTEHALHVRDFVNEARRVCASFDTHCQPAIQAYRAYQARQMAFRHD